MLLLDRTKRNCSTNEALELEFWERKVTDWKSNLISICVSWNCSTCMMLVWCCNQKRGSVRIYRKGKIEISMCMEKLISTCDVFLGIVSME